MLPLSSPDTKGTRRHDDHLDHPRPRHASPVLPRCRPLVRLSNVPGPRRDQHHRRRRVLALVVLRPSRHRGFGGDRPPHVRAVGPRSGVPARRREQRPRRAVSSRCSAAVGRLPPYQRRGPRARQHPQGATDEEIIAAVEAALAAARTRPGPLQRLAVELRGVVRPASWGSSRPSIGTPGPAGLAQDPARWGNCLISFVSAPCVQSMEEWARRSPTDPKEGRENRTRFLSFSRLTFGGPQHILPLSSPDTKGPAAMTSNATPSRDRVQEPAERLQRLSVSSAAGLASAVRVPGDHDQLRLGRRGGLLGGRGQRRLGRDRGPSGRGSEVIIGDGGLFPVPASLGHRHARMGR